MPPKFFLATKAFVEYNGKVLLLRESGSYKDGTNAGCFDIPGGRLKPGERYDEALRREVFEETGLRVSLGKVITVGEWRPIVRGEQWQIVGIFFECHAESDAVSVGSDHDSYMWISPGDFEKYNLIGNLKSAFANYLKNKNPRQLYGKMAHQN